MKQQINLLALAFITLLMVGCSSKSPQKVALVPLPNVLTENGDVFEFTEKTRIVIDHSELHAGVVVFNEKIKAYAGRPLDIISDGSKAKQDIIIKHNKSISEEGYTLKITSDHVMVESASAAGTFYALQTLLQICPNEILVEGKNSSFCFHLKGVDIEDSPQFAWRGMMLDVSRHFFTKEEVIDMIDYLAFHKINVFHWHLVDDQGWRLEIKKYPKLTEVGAWRVDREHLPWNGRPAIKPGEKATYGGFYTQEDVKEVIAYAQKRFVTVVPEIEMPGHTTSSLAAYPEYSCTGGPFNVIPGSLWPITDIYCAGNDKTFDFIEDILTEVMELFPSKYIHIGGDEANKAEWEKCKKCQARIKNEKLKDEHALQSYFIRRVEKFLTQNDRILIGWDEILEGGLAPNATVMSWRGFEGGIEAANSGHDVIMTPTSHCYLDYYQGPMDTEPLAFNGQVFLEKAYQFNPIPAELDADKAKFVLGGQGNLWTEHVADKEHMQYMTFPRMAALAEVFWTKESRREWNDFSSRISRLIQSYDRMGLNYAVSMYTVQFKSFFNEEDKTVAIELSTEVPNGEIYYTIDGSEVNANSTRYTRPINIAQSSEIKAVCYVDGQKMGEVSKVNFSLHKATAKNVSYLHKPNKKYSALGDITLVNSLRGSRNFSDGCWQGFQGVDLELTIDLDSIQSINRIKVGCLHELSSWVFMPKGIKVLVSNDGESFTEVGSTSNNVPLESDPVVMDFCVDLEKVNAQYVKVVVVNQKQIPQWHSAAGESAWLFVDEIIVE